MQCRLTDPHLLRRHKGLRELLRATQTVRGMLNGPFLWPSDPPCKGSSGASLAQLPIVELEFQTPGLTVWASQCRSCPPRFLW